MTVESLLQQYRRLIFVNNKLKYKISRAKCNNEDTNYFKYKELQKSTEYYLKRLQECTLDNIEELNDILSHEYDMYLIFKSLNKKIIK